MKKIIIAILILITIFCFVGCSKSSTPTEETIQITETIIEPTTEKSGPYHVFKTLSEDAYTDFLNNLEPNHVIVDISTGYDSSYNDYYVVTYLIR